MPSIQAPAPDRPEFISTAPSNYTQYLFPGFGAAGGSPDFNVVNLLWLYSLIFSIYCALEALMLQRSAKQCTWVTSPRYSLPEQARMGVFLARRIEGANKTIRNLHYMIILFLLVFFSGLLCYFNGLVGSNVDYHASMVSLTLIITYPLYLLYRIKNSLRPGSPHCTPFTREKIQEQVSLFDGDVLKRTLDMSRSDDDLEQFCEAIPGFCASKVVDDPQCSLDVLGLPRLAEALIEFWNRTLSSNRVPESVKVRRLVVCMRVIEAADLSIAVPHILHLLSGDLSEVSRSFEIGHSLRPLRNGNAASLARGIIASIISNAERNGRWSTLAMDELGISRDVLRDYLAHGDSVLLANLIHITLDFLHYLLQPHSDLTREALKILPSLSKFDILDTLPELQHDFCALWNDVVRQVQSSGAKNNPFMEILLDIQDLYIALHGNYDPLRPPASYPLCEDDSHRNLTTQVQWVGGFASGEASHPTATIFPTSSPVVTWQRP
jgi:Family of unknown function (DUF6535)